MYTLVYKLSNKLMYKEIKMNINKVKNAKTAAEATDCAIEWQNWSANTSMTWGDVLEWQGVFEELADKFDLREEFEYNGII